HTWLFPYLLKNFCSSARVRIPHLFRSRLPRWFSPSNRNGEFPDSHVFHSHGFVPAENLLISMLRLILRRVPIEGVEHPGFWILLSIHRKNMMHQACRRTSHQRHFLQNLLRVVENRHRYFQNAVQRFGLHLVRVAPPEIAEAVPLVVSAIEPDGQHAAGLQVLGEHLNCSLAVRRVMQYANAVNNVKALRSKRKREYIRLESNEVTIGQILRRDFGGAAEIDAHDTRSPARGYFGKAAHAASHIEHEFARQFLTPKRRLHAEVLLRLANFIVVELRFLIAMPLKTKTGGIVLGIDKPRDPVDLGIRPLACRAHVASAIVAIELRATAQTTQNGLQVSEQGLLDWFCRDRHKPPGNGAPCSAVGCSPGQRLYHDLVL